MPFKCCFFCILFCFPDSYANKPLLVQSEGRKVRRSGLHLRAPSLQASPHTDFLAGLRKGHPSKDGSQSTRMARAASRGERVCMNSSAPHLSSLTVGEWSPEGLGGRLPPVRETDRLKPRQPREGILTTVAAPCS